MRAQHASGREVPVVGCDDERGVPVGPKAVSCPACWFGAFRVLEQRMQRNGVVLKCRLLQQCCALLALVGRGVARRRNLARRCFGL